MHPFVLPVSSPHNRRLTKSRIRSTSDQDAAIAADSQCSGVVGVACPAQSEKSKCDFGLCFM